MSPCWANCTPCRKSSSNRCAVHLQTVLQLEHAIGTRVTGRSSHLGSVGSWLKRCHLAPKLVASVWSATVATVSIAVAWCITSPSSESIHKSFTQANSPYHSISSTTKNPPISKNSVATKGLSKKSSTTICLSRRHTVVDGCLANGRFQSAAVG